MRFFKNQKDSLFKKIRVFKLKEHNNGVKFSEKFKFFIQIMFYLKL